MASQTIAVIDLGTNTTRLLIADVDGGGTLRERLRETQITRLGQGVDATGRLAEEAVERVSAAVGRYARAIEQSGAGTTVAIATSAVREAADGAELVALLDARHGIRARTIEGAEEARLSFLGATADRPAGAGPLLVLDVGGGSTEYVVGRAGEPPAFSVSTRAGSVRQTERHLRDDPPTPAQLTVLREEIRAIVEGAVPQGTRAARPAGIAVAGTATSLAAIEQRLDPYDAARVQGYPLRLDACESMLAMLAATPLAERRRVPGLHPERAPTIVAGAAILVESMHAFELREMAASDRDILHGAALAAADGSL